ncbi:MAG: Zn-dependent oligopeptidase [Verrucomicrobia bacterium]|nr:Zn-dependent oligopeptidase [Verrucomicrobiota bacterium]
MKLLMLAGGCWVSVLLVCSSMADQPDSLSAGLLPVGDGALEEFRARATRFGNVVTLPAYETSVAEVRSSLERTLAEANAGLDRIGQGRTGEVTFAGTLGALDETLWRANATAGRLALVKETSPDAGVREAATEALKAYQEWAVALEYREDVYGAVRAYAATRPVLAGEEEKLLAEVLRDYRRAGLALPRADRDEVERWRKELARLGTDYESHVTKAQQALRFSRAELAGVPESFLERPGIKTGADEYTIQVNVTWQYLTVLENAELEGVRQRVLVEHHRLAKEANLPLLGQILGLRHAIARRLGYASWADYQIEVKMARDAATAMGFLRELQAGLEGKFRSEVEEFRRLKVAATGDAGARVELWDWRYFANQLKKSKYSVDAEQLRVFFPYQRVLEGMFSIYQRIFGVRFARVEPPHRWVAEVQLYAVSDAATGEPLGLFYLDMFPREGKYHHFAVFPVIEGKRLRDGSYQRPVVALVCNFPPPSPGQPSLLSHQDVETLFHEFGHAMHNMLTRAAFARFAGSNVPRDFVEAPSQMLEHWVWDKRVLDSFAADYREPTRKIPPEILAQLKAAKFATYGCHYRRQLSFGLMDLALHTRVTEADSGVALELANRTLSEVFLAQPEGAALVAYFGHLVGYDAGYYGYAWADAIAADLATVFEQAPDGYFDVGVGQRLRAEIYAVGDSRDATVSIEKFLGRGRSLEPFLRKIGAGAPGG